MRQQLAMLIAQNLDLNRSRAALEAVNGGLERDNARLKSRCLATEQVLTDLDAGVAGGLGSVAPFCITWSGRDCTQPWAAVELTSVLPSAFGHVNVTGEGLCGGSINTSHQPACTWADM